MRGQIRGLAQNNNNIEDGTSLVQTADGALGEVESLLQRLRELAVQGLNDTDVLEDRVAIQGEMDSIISEVDRIADQTEFNTLKVLKGFDRVYPITTVSTTAPHTIKTTTYIEKPLPAWLSMDSELKKNNPKVDSATTQKNTNAKLIYKDPGTGDLVTKDNWTEPLADNYTAVVDFSALGSVTGTTTVTLADGSTMAVNNLYIELNKLVETGIYSTCCTCSNQYSLFFVDDKTTETDLVYSTNNKGKINIQDLLDGAKDGTLTGNDIAASLVQKMNDKGNSLNHFTKYTVDAADPRKLVIYDWRDDLFVPAKNPNFGKLVHIPALRGVKEVTVPAA